MIPQFDLAFQVFSPNELADGNGRLGTEVGCDNARDSQCSLVLAVEKLRFEDNLTFR